MPTRRDGPSFEVERAVQADGKAPVAGVDEAGRGPWAGPVVAAAVILNPGDWPPGIDDSKKLSPAKREALFDLILAKAQVGVGLASVDDIDRLNILNATFLAMERAVAALPVAPAMVLVDGNRAPKWHVPTRTVVGGDGVSLSIGAASIVAKVTRDRLMRSLDADFPAYGWAKNAGYGTPDHQAALAAHGVTPHHRRSFAPIRERLDASVR
jgi:ribonuclease HII